MPQYKKSDLRNAASDGQFGGGALGLFISLVFIAILADTHTSYDNFSKLWYFLLVPLFILVGAFIGHHYQIHKFKEAEDRRRQLEHGVKLVERIHELEKENTRLKSK